MRILDGPVRQMGEFLHLSRSRSKTLKRRCRKCDAFLSEANPGNECFAHSYVEQDELTTLQLMGAEE